VPFFTNCDLDDSHFLLRMLSMVTAQLIMWLSTQLQGVEEAECQRVYDIKLKNHELDLLSLKE
jgi:hypothetical protein